MTLPLLMQAVQTRARRAPEGVWMRAGCRFTSQRRLVTLCAWLMRLPARGPLPQISQMRAMDDYAASMAAPRAIVPSPRADVSKCRHRGLKTAGVSAKKEPSFIQTLPFDDRKRIGGGQRFAPVTLPAACAAEAFPRAAKWARRYFADDGRERRRDLPTRLGDVIDDYCPRCRRITNHAVAALVDGAVVQTACATCNHGHDFRHAQGPPPKVRTPKTTAFDQVLAGILASQPAPAEPAAAPATGPVRRKVGARTPARSTTPKSPR